MISDRAIYSIGSAWSFGWGLLALLRPRLFYRVLSSGRQKQPTSTQLKAAKILGYAGILIGAALLLEIVLGRIPNSGG